MHVCCERPGSKLCGDALSLPLQPWQTSMSSQSQYMPRSLVWLDSSARSTVCQSLSSAGKKTAARWTPRTRGWTSAHHSLMLGWRHFTGHSPRSNHVSFLLLLSSFFFSPSPVGTLFCPQVFCRLRAYVARIVESSAAWHITVQEWNTVQRQSSLFQVAIVHQSHISIP